MPIRVCMVCSDGAERRCDDVYMARYVESPELELIIHRVSESSYGDLSVRMQQLPVADFYLNCLPEKASQELFCNQDKSGRLVRLYVAQSWDHSKIFESAKDSHYTELAGIQERHYSALLFLSAGSTTILSTVEHEQHPGHNQNDRFTASRIAVVSDGAILSVLQERIKSLVEQSFPTDLSGCLRIDVGLASSTSSLTYLSLDTEPRVFQPQNNLNDLMVHQMPGGHEALLCLVLMNDMARIEGLNAKQATVCAAFDTISSQLATTFDCIAHVSVMRSFAYHFTWHGTVLDVGCGQGVFGGLLALYHEEVDLHGTDMSQAMIRAPQIEQHYRLPIMTGPMERTLIRVSPPDHIVCFSVFQYVAPMTFIATLSQMFQKAQKSITFDIPEVSDEYDKKLKTVNDNLRPNDHLASLQRIGTPNGWKLALHRRCLSYTEPNYYIDVYSRYIRYERVQ